MATGTVELSIGLINAMLISTISLSRHTAGDHPISKSHQVNAEQFRGSVQDVPKREDIRLPSQEQLIVELYSK